jgi:hypothetical protein
MEIKETECLKGNKYEAGLKTHFHGILEMLSNIP